MTVELHPKILKCASLTSRRSANSGIGDMGAAFSVNGNHYIGVYSGNTNLTGETKTFLINEFNRTGSLLCTLFENGELELTATAREYLDGSSDIKVESKYSRKIRSKQV